MTYTHQETVLAVIVAAGKGTRMNNSIRKQYLSIAGLPILSHTLLVFEKSEVIDRIILVIPEGDFSYCKQNIIAPLKPEKKIDLVPGGLERQISVYNGLCAIDNKNSIVVIHDGVRPFVSPEHLASCITGIEESGACILGIPVHDTVKYVDRSGYIKKTPERENIWLAQTPQAFRYDLIMKAHNIARQEGYKATDDASLVERLGEKVKILHGGEYNIKITSQEDIELSKALFRSGSNPITD